jgi:cell division protein FtsB
MFVSILICLAAYAVIRLGGPQGLTVLEEKQKAARDLQDQNATLVKGNNAQRALIDKLQHDRGTQERYVRERTGKTRPGDTSFIVSDQATETKN